MQLACQGISQAYADGSIVSEITAQGLLAKIPLTALTLAVSCSSGAENSFSVQFAADAVVDPNMQWKCSSNAPSDWAWRNFDDSSWPSPVVTTDNSSWSKIVFIEPTNLVYCRRRLSKLLLLFLLRHVFY